MQKTVNDNLYKYSTQTPWQFVLVVLLYAIGAVSIPKDLFCIIFGESQCALMISTFLARAIGCLLPIWLLFEIKSKKIFCFKGFFTKLLPLIPFLMVAINNFPIVSLIQGECHFASELNAVTFICYALACLGGVLLEELCFRGIIFTTLLRKYKNNKNAIFYSVLFSSLIFGSVHIVNLLAGASPVAVIMQMGYSFLIGAMCAIAFAKSGNFYHAVLMHFVFNLGGLLTEYNLVIGNIWSTPEIIVTAVLAVAVIVYAFYQVFKSKKFIIEHLI